MFPQRLDERRAWLRRGFTAAVEYALLHRAHIFLQVGDLFDSPEPRNTERQFVAEALADLRASDVRCFGIGGNHDTPRARGGDAPPTPQGTYARLGGLRLLGDAVGAGGSAGPSARAGAAPRPYKLDDGEDIPHPPTPDPHPPIDAEILDVEGVRVAVGGMTPDPTAAPGSDPLEGVMWRPDAHVALLLLHGSLEGHVYPGAPEPIIRRDTVERLGVNCLFVGHIHSFAAFRWGTTAVVVPGATEQMTFGELGSRPGFVYVELDPSGATEIQHVSVEPQPRRQLLIPSSDLATDDPAETVKARLEAVCDREAMVRLSLEGPITRQRYHDLRLREVAEFGAARCFFLDLDTSGLYVEEDLPRAAARGGRLSPREELLRFGGEVRDASVTTEEQRLIDEAIQAILSEYE